LLTALALQEALAQMSQRWTTLGLPPIRAGIGISIGTVVAGPIGSEEQFEYTVVGDAVNLASRLQDLTRNISGYSIIISKEVHDALEERVKNQIQIVSLSRYQAMDTKQRVKHLMEFVDFGEVMVKGKKETVRVYGIPD
jgi:adenylate cyclase